MDLRLNALNNPSLSSATQAGLRRPAGTAAAGGVGTGFADNFKTALQSVSAAQEAATQLQTRVQMGDSQVSLEETMLAVQKAQIGFQATLNVRNRMVQAYTDIMNMSV